MDVSELGRQRDDGGEFKPKATSLSTTLLSSLSNAEGVWGDQALCSHV